MRIIPSPMARFRSRLDRSFIVSVSVSYAPYKDPNGRYAQKNSIPPAAAAAFAVIKLYYRYA